MVDEHFVFLSIMDIKQWLTLRFSFLPKGIRRGSQGAHETIRRPLKGSTKRARLSFYCTPSCFPSPEQIFSPSGWSLFSGERCRGRLPLAGIAVRFLCEFIARKLLPLGGLPCQFVAKLAQDRANIGEHRPTWRHNMSQNWFRIFANIFQNSIKNVVEARRPNDENEHNA